MNALTTYSAIYMVFFGCFLQAQTVTTNAELNTAINNAVPGTTITLATGTWTNVQLNFAKNGTSATPITIKAQAPGSVFIEGKSWIRMGGSYIVVEGLVFQNPSNLDTSRPIIEFKGSNTDCNHCKITNIKIDAYNGTESQKTSTYKWVLIEGQYNEISYCSFIGKYGIGSIINDNRNTSAADYTKIHHNYFAGRTPINAVNEDNDQDAIRIGNSATSLSDSFTEVYNNYFYNFSGEIEVISNKSGSNKYYNNTFENYQGALTLRHGNNCEVFNNFFFANGNPFSAGVRVMGEGHKIYNNYIQDVRSRYENGSLSNGVGGINIANGRTDGVLNGYLPVKNTTIINNTFVNCDYGIRVGTKFDASQSVAPDNVILGNNIIFLDATIANESTNRAIQVVTQLTGALSKYENNMKQAGIWDSFGAVTATGNINVPSGLLVPAAYFYRISSGSAAIDYGLGNYTFLDKDILGGIRPAALFDAGAEEFGSGGTFSPYKTTDVGVTVGFGGSPALSVSQKTPDVQNLKIYPNPIIGDYLNVLSKDKAIGRITIVDITGKVVLEKNIQNVSGHINVSKLSKGIYVVKVQGISKLFVK